MYVGIENSNEFYTHHYLSAIMAGDLKSAVFDAWKTDDDGDPRQPWYDLRGLYQDFFKLKDFLERENRVEVRCREHETFAAELLYALGYEPKPQLIPVDGGFLPTLVAIERQNGAPLLWCVVVTDRDAGEFGDPLQLTVLEEKYDEDALAATDDDFFTATVEDLLTAKAFGAEEPPRFVLVVGPTQVLLLDRSKWAEKRLLRFDLIEILGRRDTETLKATTALLHRESTCPSDGTPVLDTLDESSHKHAFGVSKDLKYALRESIELLGNEAVRHLREVSKEKVFGRALADDLTLECLRYMYRLLFLFYIEARPELGYAPIQNDTYLRGYSVERLRDLEMMKLHTDEARNGFHIHDSLKLLFDLIWDGTNDRGQQDLEALLGSKTARTSPSLREGVPRSGGGGPGTQSYHGTFELFPLKSHLFDPDRTPILNKVRIRNEVMQRIIRLMSLSQHGTGRNKRRGRISYAQLGINQLGAVYEALLSYRGFFAEHDLYEVKRKQDPYDPLETAYFVPVEDLDKYDEDERVQIDGKFVKHDKGKFIYRLAGRDREKSASYYTPESLTKCLVKYALKELLEDGEGNITKTAADILQLKVCEPAMGSAAFLNEAVNQLAEAYLQQRQKELDVRIAHEDYALEKQKVKTYIADNNVFGVDLNPVAVELAEVSLWLNTIHEGGFVPWFGMQLCCGNSLIGARRQVFLPEHTKAKKKADMWLDKVPTRIASGGGAPSPPGERGSAPALAERPNDAIYHFLLGDDGMALYKDPVIKGKGGKNPIKGLAEEEVAAIDAWRKEFNQPLSKEDHHNLVELSGAIDRLWERHTEMLRNIRRRTTDHFPVWGEDGARASRPAWSDGTPVPSAARQPTSTREKDRIWHGELFSDGVRASSPYRRLKMVMDYWCALWFWPIEKADLLPTRDEFLFELGLLLDTDVLQQPDPTQSDLFAPTMSDSEAEELVDEFGFVDVDALKKRYPRLALVDDLGQRYRFLHWELEFADLFADRGGFDLVVGNPPWIKVEWNEGGVLGDADAFLVLRNLSASNLAKLREETLDRLAMRPQYLAAYEDADATKNYLNGTQNYPELKGIQTNLYKCFITTGWKVSSTRGASALIHQKGVFDDPKGGALRAAMAARLRWHFHFLNKLKLFADITDKHHYEITVFAAPNPRPWFRMVSNVIHPSTIDDSHEHHGLGTVPTIQTDDAKWDLRGHRSRIVEVDEETLAVFAELYDPPGTPAVEARLPVVHSREILDVLRKFAKAPRKLGDLPDDAYFSTVCFDEAYAQRDGTIRREVRFPKDASEWIVSGPHFYVGTPFNKTPRENCSHNQDYDCIDLTAIPDDYLPRTNYVPACDPEQYRRRTPKFRGQSFVTYARVVCRKMIPPTGERTLAPALLPPGPAHIDGAFSIALDNPRATVVVAACWSSIVFDFFVKASGKSNFRQELASQLPVPERYREQLVSRAARLNFLTSRYAEIWEALWDDGFADDWTIADPRLSSWKGLRRKWTRDCALRNDFERRQALIEIDVLAAMSLDLTLDQLLTIYRVQFPVLRQYESDTWYDRNGRIVYTTNRGLTGVGLPRMQGATGFPTDDGLYWEDVKELPSGTLTATIIEDTMPGGPIERPITYVAPWDCPDREADYRRAWLEFSDRFGEPVPLTTEQVSSRAGE